MGEGAVCRQIQAPAAAGVSGKRDQRNFHRHLRSPQEIECQKNEPAESKQGRKAHEEAQQDDGHGNAGDDFEHGRHAGNRAFVEPRADIEHAEEGEDGEAGEQGAQCDVANDLQDAEQSLAHGRKFSYADRYRSPPVDQRTAPPASKAHYI